MDDKRIEIPVALKIPQEFAEKHGHLLDELKKTIDGYADEYDDKSIELLLDIIKMLVADTIRRTIVRQQDAMKGGTN